MEVFWDGSPAAGAVSPYNPRDTLVRIPQSWKIGESHTLQFSYQIPSAPEHEGAIGFSADAFYLPAEGWTPELPQARGVFGFGGVPPKKWDLTVRVPRGFLVHASGAGKHSGKSSEAEFRFTQSAKDSTPFVVAGHYREEKQDLAAHQLVHVWSRVGSDSFVLRHAAESLSRTVAAYDQLFGARSGSRAPLWIFECPSATGCISETAGGYSSLLYGDAVSRAADLISRDAVLVDPRAAQGSLEASVGPALAAGWLGYGRNPGFYEQQPPMSALPAFAAALAREAASGPQARREIIGRALEQIPRNAGAASNSDPAVSRAKSLLLFYALRDRVGREAFQNALQHMLTSREGRGFDVADLISALEQESHETVGPFVRQWIKRPGVPDDFRALYARTDLRRESLAQEAMR